MGITTYSLIIALIGGLILFITGVKSGVKVKYKVLFIMLGVALCALGGYGLLTSIIN